jgi:hypothetical protein
MFEFIHVIEICTISNIYLKYILSVKYISILLTIMLNFCRKTCQQAEFGFLLKREREIALHGIMRAGRE